jgi:hypothetical protein
MKILILKIAITLCSVAIYLVELCLAVIYVSACVLLILAVLFIWFYTFWFLITSNNLIATIGGLPLVIGWVKAVIEIVGFFIKTGLKLKTQTR